MSGSFRNCRRVSEIFAGEFQKGFTGFQRVSSTSGYSEGSHRGVPSNIYVTKRITAAHVFGRAHESSKNYINVAPVQLKTYTDVSHPGTVL